MVTGVFETGSNLVVQDAEQGIFIGVPERRVWLEIGDLCEIVGTTRSAAWAPMIDAERVTRLGVGALPEPLRPSRDQVLNGSLDSQYVEVQGLVTSVRDSGANLLTRVGRLEIDLGGDDRERWRQYEDAVVRVRGCVLAIYDRATRLATSGKLRFVHPLVSVDEPPPADPFAFPVKRVAALRSFDPQASPFARVNVAGQVVLARDGLYCLMDGTNGLRFAPKQPVTLAPGQRVRVAGILDLAGPSPTLREAVARSEGEAPLAPPPALDAANPLSGALDATRVRAESRLLAVGREGADEVLELRVGAHTHTARLGTNLVGAPRLAVGSRLAVTGVYLARGGDWAAGREIEGFDLAVTSPADIVVLERPPWWTPRRLLALAGGLGTVLLLALAWIGALRRQVEERTRQLAHQIQARQRVEQQRALDGERTRLARDLHDELGGGLTEIGMLGYLASDGSVATERRAGFLGQMTERARQLVGALDEIVWAVNPRYDSLSSLAGYYSLYAQRFLGLASLDCRLDIPESLPERPLDSNVRHGLFLAFKEALNNVVRHAQATSVRLRIEVVGEELRVIVADNGRGIDPGAAAEPGRGWVGGNALPDGGVARPVRDFQPARRGRHRAAGRASAGGPS